MVDHELIPGSRLVVQKHCGHGLRCRLLRQAQHERLSKRPIEAFLDDVESGRLVAGERVV
jgi:hypothetical protein